MTYHNDNLSNSNNNGLENQQENQWLTPRMIAMTTPDTEGKFFGPLERKNILDNNTFGPS
jgi:hypothetical protein